MRIPLGVTLESRDGSVTNDAKVLNGIVETKGEQNIVRKRPGVGAVAVLTAGKAQLLYPWNGVNAMIGDTLYRGTTATSVSTTAFSPTNANLRFDAQEVGSSAATQRLMVKNKTQAWVVDRAGAKTAITFPSAMGATTYPVASLTRTGAVATATFLTDPGFNVGDTVTIAGATPIAYNGAQTVTAITPGVTTPARSVPISSLTRSGTTATAVTSVPHGLTSTSTYAVSGADQAAYNISAVVTVTNSTTFTYTVTVTAPGTTTWNPADKSAAVTLSGGNLAASATTGSLNNASVRGTVGKNTGKWYWEYTITTFDPFSGTMLVGVSNLSFPINTTAGVGTTSDSWAWSSFGGAIHGGATVGNGGQYTHGDVIGFALDMNAGTLTLYINGSATGIVFTGLTGVIYPTVSMAITAITVTANFGATAFAFTAPTGFSALFSNDPATPATGSPIVTVAAVSTAATMSYAIGGSPATPATGSITAQGNGGMVPGIAYIDGYFVVMDTNGVMWASNIDDPTTFAALANLTAQDENGAGKAIGKSGNYLIAHKEWSTEPYYDAKVTPFPFLPVDNGFTQVGCASGESVKYLDGSIFWLSQVRQRGRSVHMMAGLQQQKVSTPDVERILNADPLTTVYAYGLKVDGHSLYLLTLVASNITLVYDATTQVWLQWSSYGFGSNVAITSITLSGTTATVTATSAHGVNDGDPVLIFNADQTAYNGVFQAQVVSSTVFTYRVTGNPATPATGALGLAQFTESYFKFTQYCDYNGLNLFLHESDGTIYNFTNVTTDNALPINFFVRTSRLDGGSVALKAMSSATLIGDKVGDFAMVRFSDDDCATFKAYRPVDLSSKRPQARRLGSFRRRTLEVRHIGSTAPRFEALELEIG